MRRYVWKFPIEGLQRGYRGLLWELLNCGIQLERRNQRNCCLACSGKMEA